MWTYNGLLIRLQLPEDVFKFIGGEGIAAFPYTTRYRELV